MTATAQMRGHPVYWDGSLWRYADDGSLAPANGGQERPCTACGRIAEGDYGPDPCLGWIEGSTGACCGHRRERCWGCAADRAGPHDWGCPAAVYDAASRAQEGDTTPEPERA